MASPILFSIVMAAAPAVPPPDPSMIPARPLQACYAWGPRPPACVEPPLREMFKAYASWRANADSHAQDPLIVRGASQISDYDAPLPKDAFPAFMRQGELRVDAWVQMELVIGADGAVKSCMPGKVRANINTDDRKSVEIPADRELGERTCTVVRQSRKFRPAIDALGRPVESTLGFDAHYSRERYELLAPPAPPPPSRWINRNTANPRQSWVPYRYGSEPVRISPPRFKQFLTDKAKLPREAVVGVVMSFAPAGQPLTCEVKLPSGEQRLDDATCAALMAVQSQPTRYPVNDVPIEVTWRGTRAWGLIAGNVVMPQLVVPVPIPEAERALANPPRWPITVRLPLDGQGKAMSCRVVAPSFDDKLDAASCRIARELARFTGARDDFDRPIGSTIDLRADWKTGQIYFSGY
ncbi:MAG: hypothetical protein ACKOPO_03420 [Novosphingobium sp.]